MRMHRAKFFQVDKRGLSFKLCVKQVSANSLQHALCIQNFHDSALAKANEEIEKAKAMLQQAVH